MITLFEDPPPERRASEAFRDAGADAGGGKGLAVAALVLGLAAVLSAPFVVGLGFGLAGACVAAVALRPRRAGRAMAAWGAGLSLAGVTLGLAAGLFYAWLYRTVVREGPRSARSARYEILRSEGQPAPGLVVETLERERLDLNALRGRRVVLNFWATWCAACRAEVPHLARLARESPRDELLVVGISDEPPATLSAFARRHGIDYPLVADTDSDTLPSPFNRVRALPTTVVVDRDGVMRAIRVGGLGYDELRALAGP